MFKIQLFKHSSCQTFKRANIRTKNTKSNIQMFKYSNIQTPNEMIELSIEQDTCLSENSTVASRGID